MIWRQEPKIIGRGHFGGRLAFSPDGKLFISSGNCQRFEPAQDLGSNSWQDRTHQRRWLHSARQSIREQDRCPGRYLGAGKPQRARPCLQPSIKAVVEHEMGPKGGDEVNLIERGKNYSWPIVSPGEHYDDTPIPRHSTRPEFAAPLQSWNPSISNVASRYPPIASLDGALSNRRIDVHARNLSRSITIVLTYVEAVGISHGIRSRSARRRFQ